MEENDEGQVEETQGTDALEAKVTERLEQMQGTFTSSLEKQNQMMSAIVEHLQNSGQEATQANVAQAAAKVEEVDYDTMSTAEIVSHIRQQVEADVKKELTVTQKQSAERDGALREIQRDYPEAVVEGHAMQDKIVELHSALPEGIRDTAHGLKLAALQAAQELGIKPRSKRSNQEDEAFVLSGKGNKGAKEQRTELDPMTKAFAEQCGLDLNDKKVVERLKERSKRSNWSTYK